MLQLSKNMFIFYIDLVNLELFQFTHGTPFWDKRYSIYKQQQSKYA